MTDLDIGATLRALDAGRVRFVVTGGVAVAAHGHIRGTEDVDIVPDPDGDNLLALGNALVALDARLLLGDQAPFGPRGARRARANALTLRRGISTTSRPSAGPADAAQTGTTPCRFHGRSIVLPSAISSARQITGRVSRGSMTSSIIPLRAAM